ncbi:MAG TPA: hypothetical protein VKF35_25820, partial [Hyphomicrobiaceae bacterium]|nr:hypothetical protein [Hyphomicrobiaceae bacterium]
ACSGSHRHFATYVLRELLWFSVHRAQSAQAHLRPKCRREGGLRVGRARGLGECRTSRWISDSAQLAKIMSSIMCRAGETQIEKVLNHASKETKLLGVSALVFVGDALEESPDIVLSAASALGRLDVPAFMFQEGHDRLVEQTFQDITRLTHGAYCRFDPGAARQLAELLRAVAVFATGGLTALADQHNASAVKLLSQLR